MERALCSDSQSSILMIKDLIIKHRSFDSKDKLRNISDSEVTFKEIVLNFISEILWRARCLIIELEKALTDEYKWLHYRLFFRLLSPVP